MWHAKELGLVPGSCNNPLNDLKMYVLFMLKKTPHSLIKFFHH